MLILEFEKVLLIHWLIEEHLRYRMVMMLILIEILLILIVEIDLNHRLKYNNKKIFSFLQLF
jgi:hypothetical protein